MRPRREHATDNRQTYFVTSRTAGGRSLFQVDRWADLFVKHLYHYRAEGAYLLHAFVVMPDHFHAIITPTGALERAMQYIKGGFSHRAKREFDYKGEVWQKGFSDHRIRDGADYERHVEYIRQNPVRKHLCGTPEEYAYSSAHPGFELDPVPQGLKPQFIATRRGAAEAAPFQSGKTSEDLKGRSFSCADKTEKEAAASAAEVKR